MVVPDITTSLPSIKGNKASDKSEALPVSVVDPQSQVKSVNEGSNLPAGNTSYLFPLPVIDDTPIPEDKRPTLIVGESLSARELREMIDRIAYLDSKVLITGETGTGKELVAREIHINSLRSNEPFIPVNCAAIPEGMIDSELFGHEKGAFTGATARRIGRFEAANGGTIFLDEIGELPRELQEKLNRIIESGTFERVGGGKEVKVNVRIIAATNIDIEAALKDKKFSQSLYYRLNVLPIHLPPLRDRKEDIPELVKHFLDKYKNLVPGKKVKAISPSAIEKLNSHNWPGNIRELENVIRRAIIFADDEVIQRDNIAITEQEARAKSGEKIKEIALSDVSVIINGETGVGKERVANELVKLSSRSAKPFEVINCATLGKGLAESKLFGHEKNSFTGACEAHKGKLEMADGGTVFLDELAELDPSVQTKLLRFLQEGEVVPVGISVPRKVNVRIITATNVNLERAVKEGRFREDLYHRLNVISINVSPLRERKEMIPELALELLDEIIPKVCPGKEIKGFSPEALIKLQQYSYPGNIRELKNIIERAVIFVPGGNQIQEKDLQFLALGLEPEESSGEILNYDRHPVYLKYKSELTKQLDEGKRPSSSEVKLLNIKLKIIHLALTIEGKLSETLISNECDVSRSTLSRLIQQGGYDSTKDLINQLISEIKQSGKKAN